MVARPTAKTFINGLASCYSEEYDEARLGEYIDKREYEQIMERINDILINYFPCPLSWCCGYVCAIFTLGLSLLCPYMCIKDAEEQVDLLIHRLNARKLNKKSIKLVLRKKCSTSWIEWHLLDTGDTEKNALKTQKNVVHTE